MAGSDVHAPGGGKALLGVQKAGGNVYAVDRHLLRLS